MESKSDLSVVKPQYRGKVILITGSTGFMGKVLVSKLLHSCGDEIKRIYLLIRPKRGVNANDRLKHICESKVLSNVSDSHKRKMKVIDGNITEPHLGISEDDRLTLASEVNIIFHSAATVKFNELLTLSVAMNVGGTLSILEFASTARSLEAFIHVSTAYCNPQQPLVEEKVYTDRMVWCAKSIMDLVEERGEVINTEKETKKILGGWPNTYTFTKAIAEKAILEASDRIPIALIRPSIVVASYRDPFPGWVDNYNGPSGIVAGAGTGLLRSMHVDLNNAADLIPVDICINLMIVMAYKVMINHKNNSKRDIQVYNSVSGDVNPIYWSDVDTYVRKYIRKYPFEKMFWFPECTCTQYYVYDRISQFLFHKIPAIFGDACLMAINKKPFLKNINTRMFAAFASLEYFANSKWMFRNPNVTQLHESLPEVDRREFAFNVREVDWDQFMENYVVGIRHFVLKGDPKSVPECRRRLFHLQCVHISFQIFFAFLIYMFLSYLYRAFNN